MALKGKILQEICQKSTGHTGSGLQNAGTPQNTGF